MIACCIKLLLCAAQVKGGAAQTNFPVTDYGLSDDVLLQSRPSAESIIHSLVAAAVLPGTIGTCCRALFDVPCIVSISRK